MNEASHFMLRLRLRGGFGFGVCVLVTEISFFKVVCFFSFGFLKKSNVYITCAEIRIFQKKKTINKYLL
jgi:hypothetical protein